MTTWFDLGACAFPFKNFKVIDQEQHLARLGIEDHNLWRNHQYSLYSIIFMDWKQESPCCPSTLWSPTQTLHRLRCHLSRKRKATSPCYPQYSLHLVLVTMTKDTFPNSDTANGQTSSTLTFRKGNVYIFISGSTLFYILFCTSKHVIRYFFYLPVYVLGADIKTYFENRLFFFFSTFFWRLLEEYYCAKAYELTSIFKCLLSAKNCVRC